MTSGQTRSEDGAPAEDFKEALPLSPGVPDRAGTSGISRLPVHTSETILWYK